MRTIQQYVDWMKLCQQLDPDCTYLVHHNSRQYGATNKELQADGATPLKHPDVEKELRK